MADRYRGMSSADLPAEALPDPRWFKDGKGGYLRKHTVVSIEPHTEIGYSMLVLTSGEDRVVKGTPDHLFEIIFKERFDALQDSGVLDE